MTTYTVNGHSHSMVETPAERSVGMVTTHAVPPGKMSLRTNARPEKFSCLESPEPRAQLQAALQQIESLLNENAELRNTVLVLGQSLSSAHSLLQDKETLARSDRIERQLLHDLHASIKQLR